MNTFKEPLQVFWVHSRRDPVSEGCNPSLCLSIHLELLAHSLHFAFNRFTTTIENVRIYAALEGGPSLTMALATGGSMTQSNPSVSYPAFSANSAIPHIAPLGNSVMGTTDRPSA